jgi:hypothetical protein
VGGGGPAGRDGPEGGVAEAADGGGTSAGEPGVTRPRPSLLKVAVVQFALSVALTIGSLWVTRPLYDASGAPRASRYRAVSAAYSGNVAFSPLDPVVNLALVLAGIAYTDYMFLGLTLLVIVVAATMVNEIPLWLRGRGGRAGWARGAKTPGATPGASTADDQDMGATDAGAEVAAGAAPLPPDFAGVFVRAVVLIAIVVAGKLVIALPNEVAETGL